MLRHIFFHSMRKFYFSLKPLLTCLCFIILVSFSLKATEASLPLEAAKKKYSSHPIHIVSPEAVEIQKKLNFLGSRYPKLSQPRPVLSSREDFQLARQYLNISNNYRKIWLGVITASPQSELLDYYHQVCKGVLTYVETLQSSAYVEYRSKTDEKELKENFYESNYQLGMNFLMLLALFDFQEGTLEHLQTAQGYVKEIKAIKDILSNNRKYRKILQTEIEKVQNIKPYIIPLFDPGSKLVSHQQPRKLSKRIQYQQELSHHKKISNSLSSFKESTFKDSFDLYFQVTTHEIFTKAHQIALKRKDHDEYFSALQELNNNYLKLENEGFNFRAQLLQLEQPSKLDSLNPDQLRSLYEFFSERYAHLPTKNPVLLLPHVINIFINANNLLEALIRTEVLKVLLLQKGELSEAFICFRAGLLVLNGNSEEWNLILEQKRRANDQRKAGAHQKRLTHIKKTLKQLQEEEGQSFGVTKNPATKEGQIAYNARLREAQPPSNFAFELSSNPHINYKSEIVFPREKIKTRKSSQAFTTATLPIVTESASTSEIPSSLKRNYFLSKKALKTYRKIRTGDWKFSRKDLYNLFEKLGCTIDISQGKGDHSKILVPLDMTIEKEGHLIAAIPEFRSGEVSTLTIPNWDHKWDGRVPPYLIKIIVGALEILNATDETVHNKKPDI
jgi:hypothetical protein